MKLIETMKKTIKNKIARVTRPKASKVKEPELCEVCVGHGRVSDKLSCETCQGTGVKK